MALFLPTTPLIIMSRKKNRKHNISRLERTHSKLQPRPVFYLICEGKKTEPDYFRALNNSLTPKSNVNLKFPFGSAVPYEVAKRAVKFKNSNSQSQRRVSSFNQNDQVWAVLIATNILISMKL